MIENKNILFNGLKHHIESVRRFLHEQTVETLPKNLLKIGGSQMDFYKGNLSENEIFTEMLELLRGLKILTAADFEAWVANGFQVISLSDNSMWVLRLSDSAQQFIHLHPARYSPLTCRVKAGTLKMSIALAMLDPNDIHIDNLAFFNQIRTNILALSPVKKIEDMILLKTLKKEIMQQ